MVDKILEYRRMKVCLQNAIGAVHGAKCADMQNLIVTAPVCTGARAFFDKSALVSGKKKDRLSLLYGIIRGCKRIINLLHVLNHYDRRIYSASDGSHWWQLCHLPIDIKFRN
jgi:hypothetical protein